MDKLKLNHGDLKATQGDTGHAQVSMIKTRGAEPLSVFDGGFPPTLLQKP